MDQLVDKIISNPLHLVITIILAILVLYAIVKRVIKLLLFLVIVVAAFLAYVHYTGSTVKDTLKKVGEKVK